MFKKLFDQLISQYVWPLKSQTRQIHTEMLVNRVLVGRLLVHEIKKSGQLANLYDAEFKVFSQWGDDGIIQYLVNYLDIPVKKFIEFGVENYTESNTRFLMVNDNWSGLVMDCSDENVAYIKNDDIYWKHDLTAITSFVTVENINYILAGSGYTGEIGLLHIDVDGNDFWIWKAINVVSPVIVIVEYNSLFGAERAITIPYDPTFNRMDAHQSGIYAGASLSALCGLADEKGYSFVGANSAGNNAYFVRRDRLKDLRGLSAVEGYVLSKFREHRDENGQLTYLPGHEAIKSVHGMPIFNTRTNQIEEL